MTATEERTAEAAAASLPLDRAWFRALAPFAGPVLIVASVLVVLHDIAFRGMVSSQHPDLLSFFLPTHCFLGQSLAAGRIPAWNPYSMAGVPFAADPQSGWLNLPAMILYAALPCDIAVRWYVVALPLMGGLGIYWFLRDQDVSRPAATVGGLLLALAVAGSAVTLVLPFSAALAWTAILLAVASRFFSARTWPARLAWAALVAVAWGQLAAAHMSHGLIVGSGAVAAYAIARVIREIRGGFLSGPDALIRGALLLAALPLVNLAVFLPRLAYLPRTTLGVGYQDLYRMATAFAGVAPRPFIIGHSAAVDWPLALAASPGLYLGAAGLALSFAGFLSRRYRALVAAFAVFGGICYLLSPLPVARAVGPLIAEARFFDLYLHGPSRFRYGTILALVVMAALGVEAWRRASSSRTRVLMLAPAAAVWGLLPLALGALPARLWLFGGAAVIAIPLLFWAVRRPRFLALVPVVLAAELVANGISGQAQTTQRIPNGIDRPSRRVPFTPMLEPGISARERVRPGPIGEILLSATTGRYLRVNPGADAAEGMTSEPASEPERETALGGRTVPFRVEVAQGYNPVQQLRFWAFARAAERKWMRYNHSVFNEPSRQVLDLLQVGWLVGPANRAPVEGAYPVVTEGGLALYRLTDVSPRAEVVTSWEVASPGSALGRVLDSKFHPSDLVILERDPGISPRPAAGTGSAVYRSLSAQSAEIVVDSPTPGIVLVRNAWDPGWRASVDGRDAPVLVADFLMQGVPVPAGRHTVILRYDDPWVGYGLLASGLSLAALVGTAALFRFRRRRPDSVGSTGDGVGLGPAGHS